MWVFEDIDEHQGDSFKNVQKRFWWETTNDGAKFHTRIPSCKYVETRELERVTYYLPPQ